MSLCDVPSVGVSRYAIGFEMVETILIDTTRTVGCRNNNFARTAMGPVTKFHASISRMRV